MFFVVTFRHNKFQLSFWYCNFFYMDLAEVLGMGEGEGGLGGMEGREDIEHMLGARYEYVRYMR